MIANALLSLIVPCVVYHGIQETQKISVVLVVSSESVSEEAAKFYEVTSKKDLDLLAEGRYLRYFNNTFAVLEDGDPLGVESLEKVVSGINSLKQANMKPGERKLLGDLPKQFKEIAKVALEDPNFSVGKLKEIDKVSTSVFPSTVVHLENNGKSVFFVLDGKEVQSPPPKPDSLPEAEDASPTDAKRAKKASFTVSGDLKFSFGFRGGAKTQRELINEYMTKRVPDREDALLKLRNALDSWSSDLESTRSWKGKSFDQLPVKVQEDLMRRGLSGGNFSSDLEKAQFFAGAKVSKTSSFLTLDAYYKDKKGARKNVQAPLTPVLNPS